MKLKEIAKVQGGYAFKSNSFVKGKTPVIRIGNISNQEITIDNNITVDKSIIGNNTEFLVIKNDILIAMSGATVGKVGIYKFDAPSLLNQRVGNIKTKNKYRKYIYYLLQSPSFQKYIELNAFGCAQPNISGNQIENFEFNKNSDLKIKEIVNKLDKIVLLIKIRKKQIQKCDNLIKSQFVEMFGYINKYKNLSEYSELITKGASPKWQGIDYTDDGTLFVTSENVRDGYVDITKPKYLDNKINDILPRSVLKKNDILINIVGASIGRVARYDYDYLANINQAVALVRTKNINTTYLLKYLNSEYAIKMYDDMKKGGARENLSLKNISDLKIIDAPIELQNKFAKIVEQIDKQKLELEKSLKKLEELKFSLMQEYFG